MGFGGGGEGGSSDLMLQGLSKPTRTEQNGFDTMEWAHKNPVPSWNATNPVGNGSLGESRFPLGG
jgi:hypothetical protein